MNNDGFYMVYVEGGESPKQKHTYESHANDEAKRLAELTGKPVYVLFAQERFEVQRIVRTVLDNPNPF